MQQTFVHRRRVRTQMVVRETTDSTGQAYAPLELEHYEEDCVSTAESSSTHTEDKDVRPLTAISEYRPRKYKKHFRVVLVTCVLIWVFFIILGVFTHRGRFGISKRNTPLAWFDAILRRVGQILPGMVLVLRTFLVALLNKQDITRLKFGAPVLLYLAQAGVRVLIYHLHNSGYFYNMHTVAEADGHFTVVEQVMSDHILLGASIVAQCISEACLAITHARDRRNTPLSSLALSLPVVLAMLVAMLTSLDACITARFFHPVFETLAATAAGLLLFFVPVMLWLRYLAAALEAP